MFLSPASETDGSDAGLRASYGWEQSLARLRTTWSSLCPGDERQRACSAWLFFLVVLIVEFDVPLISEVFANKKLLWR